MGKNLYHYTSIDTLEKILESKKIRFTSLKGVDDRQEQWTADLYNHGKHIFVACFTAKEKESIPMWNMHKGNGEGVRIKFRYDIIKKFKHNYRKEDINYLVVTEGAVYPIEYTEDEEKIRPKVIVEPNGISGIGLAFLGKHKSIEWDFQEEWRYSLYVYDYVLVDNDYKVGVHTLPIDFYDVAINKAALYDMEITLGYNVNANEKQRVDKFINDFNKKNKANIKVVQSTLTGKVR